MSIKKVLFTPFLAMYLKPIGKTTVNRPQAILPPNAGSFAASVLLVIRKDLFAEPEDW